MLCRFTGHTRQFYSVAEHCVHVSRCCPPEAQRAALLHDATEAYLSDISRPVKHIESMQPYRTAEAKLDAVIYLRFDMLREVITNQRVVGVFDDLLLSLEAKQLIGPLLDGWSHTPANGYPHLDLRLECWQPAEACVKFLERFYDLFPAEQTPALRRAIAFEADDIKWSDRRISNG